MPCLSRALKSGAFYTCTGNLSPWCTCKLDKQASTFAFCTRGYALATARRAYFCFAPDARLPLARCPLCRSGEDNATHWSQWEALRDHWKEVNCPLCYNRACQ